MAAGKMTPFYIALGAAAVLGGILIARQAGGRSAPQLRLDAAIPVTPGPRGVVLGSDSAPVEMVEFADFECPACGRYFLLNMSDIKQRLVATGRLRLRFIHFPLPIHPRAPLAHLAAACANEQGPQRFWSMHDLLYESQEEWTHGRNPERIFATLAERAQLDMSRYDSCISEQRAWGQVLNDKALGDSLGVGGTPTFLINGREFNEALNYDRVRQIVDSIAPPAAPAPARR